MSLYEKIELDIKTAFKTGDTLRRSVLVMLKSAVKNKAIDKREKDIEPSDQMVLDVVSLEVKRHKDTIAQYEGAGRGDAAAQEKMELVVLMEYMPAQLSEEKIVELVEEAIAAVKPQSEKDFGKVMAVLAPSIKDRADGAVVSKIVKQKLLG